MASSGLQRLLFGTSLRQFECVMRTGFRDTVIASSVVRSAQCETSMAMPSSFIRWTTLAP
jgi:hypothetical protein